MEYWVLNPVTLWKANALHTVLSLSPDPWFWVLKGCSGQAAPLSSIYSVPLSDVGMNPSSRPGDISSLHYHLYPISALSLSHLTPSLSRSLSCPCPVPVSTLSIFHSHITLPAVLPLSPISSAPRGSWGDSCGASDPLWVGPCNLGAGSQSDPSEGQVGQGGLVSLDTPRWEVGGDPVYRGSMRETPPPQPFLGSMCIPHPHCLGRQH